MANESHRQALVGLVAAATQRLTAADLIHLTVRRLGVSARQARTLLRESVDAGSLAFYPDGGGSFVDISFERCVAIGRRLAICPAEGAPGSNRIAVRLRRGASFGCGRHPTTRLALRAIEAVCDQAAWTPGFARVLDIGTGSGVLAIAALLLGAAAARAIDIDPVSLAEARANFALNGLAAKAAVDGGPLETIDGAFDLVLANLRYPTLCRLAGRIGALTAPAGRIVLSGFRPEEAADIVTTYAGQAMRRCWQEAEKGWMALGLEKGK